MISLEEIRARYKRGDHSMHISDQSAHDFVKIIEAGGSIECVIEIMTGLYSTYDVDIREQTKRAMAIDRLIRCEIVRRSALFCAFNDCTFVLILSPISYLLQKLIFSLSSFFKHCCFHPTSTEGLKIT
jgi:hypothetical protein